MMMPTTALFVHQENQDCVCASYADGSSLMKAMPKRHVISLHVYFCFGLALTGNSCDHALGALCKSMIYSIH